MSHVATIKIEVKDLGCLKKAAAACGLQWKEGQKTYKWYGQWVNDYNSDDAAYKSGIDPKDYGKCSHAIGVPGNSAAYEIGVVEKGDGTWTLVWDFWAGGHGLMQLCSHNGSNGKDADKLVQAYAKEVTKQEIAALGYSFETEKLAADGTIELEFNYND